MPLGTQTYPSAVCTLCGVCVRAVTYAPSQPTPAFATHAAGDGDWCGPLL